jgi:23S rRNA (adenine1618-N6)-methyltransferase
MKPPARTPARHLSKSRPATAATTGLHPRNRHQGHYEFATLVAQSPALATHLVTTPAGTASVDFSDPLAVRALNRALLRSQYGIVHWDIPPGYLCPPVPGRADYVHGLADLLATDHDGVVPRGAAVRVLDIGVGASCIYPLIGNREYGWRFVGTDTDTVALGSAQAIVDSNDGLRSAIELRRQAQRGSILAGVLHPGERFHLSLCNPPFHASADDAAQASRRKQVGLGRSAARGAGPALNFGGQPGELWCTGGETAFLRRMVDESVAIATQVCWFSSLVSRADTLPALQRQLQRSKATDVRVVPMAQGNKQSRFIAWTFLDAAQRRHYGDT